VGAAPDWSIENNGVGALLFLGLEGANVLGIMPPLSYTVSKVRATTDLSFAVQKIQQIQAATRSSAEGWGEMDGSDLSARA
jgi:hypothetical protein